MEIDRTTLADLEVFGSPDGDGGLFHLIDRTATSRGRVALRRRFEHPLSGTEEIRRTQDAVRFLQRHPALLNLDESSIDPAARYLRSNIMLGTASPVWGSAEYAWMALRYRDVLKEIRAGVDATVALLNHVASLSASIADLNPPPLISEIAGILAGTSDAVLRAISKARALLRVDRALRTDLKERIQDALGRLSELDALNAMASATSSFKWVMPELVESANAFVLDAEDVIHPFVKNPTANPVRLSGGEPMVFLTGPNMAGKTTYLRSVALVVLLAQVGMGVPARRLRLTPVDALFTSLNPSDNLRAGLSYFLAEVHRVKAAATILAEGRRALVLFDEVFKGTNVRDALDASAEVILGFARSRRSGFIFSSHLVELVEALEANPAIRFCFFDGDIVSGAPHYTYELRDGVSAKRFGLLLLRQAQVPELMARIGA
jgi:DNA mismatch repair protein MutS